MLITDLRTELELKNFLSNARSSFKSNVYRFACLFVYVRTLVSAFTDRYGFRHDCTLRMFERIRQFRLLLSVKPGIITLFTTCEWGIIVTERLGLICSCLDGPSTSISLQGSVDTQTEPWWYRFSSRGGGWRQRTKVRGEAAAQRWGGSRWFVVMWFTKRRGAGRGHFADKRSARNAPTGLKMFDVWPEVQ